MTREEILAKAKECVCGQRKQDYGNPEDNFSLIAALWTNYIRGGRTPKEVAQIDNISPYALMVTPKDVAMMMALLKIARIRNGGTGDSFVDLAGYAACGGEIQANRAVDAVKRTIMQANSQSAENTNPVMERR